MDDQIEIWNVLHMYSHVASKNKFHVVCCIEPKPLAFLINSEIGQFLQNRPHLLVCNPLIKNSEHNFLSHDSYVACCEPVSLVGIEDNSYEIVGVIHDSAKKEVIEGVEKSPVLVSRQREWILNSLR